MGPRAGQMNRRERMPTLHPQIERVLKIIAQSGMRPIESLSPTEARQQMEETARARKAEPLPIARTEDRAIPGPGGPIPLRLYWPNAATGKVPAIAYYHGGG